MKMSFKQNLVIIGLLVAVSGFGLSKTLPDKSDIEFSIACLISAFLWTCIIVYENRKNV